MSRNRRRAVREIFSEVGGLRELKNKLKILDEDEVNFVNQQIDKKIKVNTAYNYVRMIQIFLSSELDEFRQFLPLRVACLQYLLIQDDELRIKRLNYLLNRVEGYTPAFLLHRYIEREELRCEINYLNDFMKSAENYRHAEDIETLRFDLTALLRDKTYIVEFTQNLIKNDEALKLLKSALIEEGT